MNNQNGFIARHGGYKNLKSFQNAEIVYDFTVEFCKYYIPSHKMRDQLEGAARSGVQNIVEGSHNAGTSKQTELRLVSVARASLEELLRDYKDFLRQRGLVEWSKDHVRAKEVRALVYMPNRSYMTYRTYVSDPENAANCALCLISQTTYLLDRQMQALEQDLLRNGDAREQFKYARNEELKRRMLNPGPPFEEFLAEVGKRQLPDGRVVSIDSAVQ